MSKHTPGPWAFVEWSGHRSVSADDSASGFSITADGYLLPLCDLDGDLDEAEANARLIAAAPALLEALQDLTLNVNEAMGTGGWVPTPVHASFWAAMLDSLAAIAAATGAQAGEGAGRG